MMHDRFGQSSLGETMFGDAQLGDRRRTQRLVDVVNQLLKHPAGSLPEKLKSPADLKALYRLCARDEVTHSAIIDAQNQGVSKLMEQSTGPILILHDDTELDFTSMKSLKDQLGQIGKGTGRGYICHNSLAVLPDGREVLGLVNQILHCRVEAPENETLAEHRERESRESRLWLEGTKRSPADWRLVDVADQGADTFEFLEHEVHSGRRFVIRNRHARKCAPSHDATCASSNLHKYARSLEPCGETAADVQYQPRHGKHPERPARRARLLISAAEVLVYPPHARHGNHGRDPLPMWIVHVWEPNPPQGATPIEWRLLTNEPVESLETAMQIVEWYRARWVIEEFHKAQKTGCGVEQLQFTNTSRLDVMIAVLSGVATQLLNLRSLSRQPDAKQRRATTLFAREYVEVLSGWRYGAWRDLTIHEFFYALARLGGHQNRRGDKRPGWLILWRGWTTLQAMLEGAEAIRWAKCG